MARRIRHEHERKQVPATPLDGLFQLLKHPFAIDVIEKNHLSRASVRHDVVDRTRVFHPQWASHADIVKPTSALVNEKQGLTVIACRTASFVGCFKCIIGLDYSR